jgi:hypothetical protein
LLRPTAKAAVVETTDATEVWRPGARPRLRHRLRRIHLGRPAPSQLVLAFAAFVFGLAASAVVSVGIWQHTASKRDNAQAARAAAENRLRDTRLQVAHLQAKLTAERVLLAQAKTKEAALSRREASLAASLAAARRTNGAIATRLPGQLAAIAATAAALARQSSSAVSELTGLQAYLTSSGGSIDAGYLTTQVRYLIGASRSTQAETSRLQSDVAAASDTVAVLHRAE